MKINTIKVGKKVAGMFRSRRPQLHSETLVGLTPSGRQMADDESAPGLKYDILVALSHGEKTVGDLARDIGESVETTKETLLRMKGSVRFQDVD